MSVCAGQEWARVIDAHLNSADIILLLVSPDLLASDYYYDVEVKRTLTRHEVSEAQVVPILLRPIDWLASPFGKLKSLPMGGFPVTRWSNLDDAFLDVAQEIRKAIVLAPSYN